ncbi:MAG: nucleotidyltransferase family protein [Sphingobacteriales bacterium]|uniref:nucleotidyltransferase family protein n=1 Tax=Hydrotalea flava TaxID=714549 RepID=UPI000F9625B5|nr:sugar phosphate nucleotidyltransferase [Hydrotalea flava]RTL47298.1 MAG: nucleotidyltransferase family protein [Sphingobacteriales bacterium]
MNSPSPHPVIKAMLLSAGLGTRLQPFTLRHPKALAMVNGKSLLQRNICYLQQFGITNVVVNVHHFADQIMAAIQANQGWGSTIKVSDESSEVLETGGALYHARHLLYNCDAIVLMNVDVLTNLNIQQMLAQHWAHNGLATLAVTQRTGSRYFLFNRQNRLCGWRNQKTGEEKLILLDGPLYPKAFSGIHILHPNLLQRLPGAGKYSMVDVYLKLAPDYPILCFDHTGDDWIDAGTPERLAVAGQLFI